MDIVFNCPRCGQHLSVQDRGAGMAVNCPSCEGQIEIPSGTAPQAPTLPSLPRMPETKKKKGRAETPASVGGACALVAAFASLVSPTRFCLLSLPLLFAAFVLAIVSLVRGRVVGGICLLIGLFPALMMAFVTLTDRDKLLNREHVQTHSTP